MIPTTRDEFELFRLMLDSFIARVGRDGVPRHWLEVQARVSAALNGTGDGSPSMRPPTTHTRDMALLLTPKEAADMLAMSERWLRGSDVPRVRIGRAVRYRRADLERWVEAL